MRHIPAPAILLLLTCSVASAEQRAVMASSTDAVSTPRATTGPAVGKRSPHLQPYAQLYGPPPAGIAVSADSRIFISFPDWGDAREFTVGELRPGGKLVPFPEAEVRGFKSVQGIFMDDKNHLWLLDAGAQRLAAYDIGTQKKVKNVAIPGDAVRGGTYLNDLCICPSLGTGEGVAFISDSGTGAIIVLDLGTEQAWRRLEKHPSTKGDPSVVPTVEGTPMKVVWHCDGIAVSPDGERVYYTPFTSHTIWSVDAAALVDRNRSDDDVAETVKKLADKPSINDGITCGADGNVYTTDEEDQAIRRISPDGKVETIVQDERLLWPDSVCVKGAYLYTVTNQLHRMAKWHDGKDQRQPPYVVFRVPLNG